MKPIYNHKTGKIDEDEEIIPTPIMILEGLHPFYDDRVNDLLDFRIYIDITAEVKFNWKVQRDSAERGHPIAKIKEEIQKRKHDFENYIDPQKNMADCVIKVLSQERDSLTFARAGRTQCPEFLRALCVLTQFFVFVQRAGAAFGSPGLWFQVGGLRSRKAGKWLRDREPRPGHGSSRKARDHKRGLGKLSR